MKHIRAGPSFKFFDFAHLVDTEPLVSPGAIEDHPRDLFGHATQRLEWLAVMVDSTDVDLSYAGPSHDCIDEQAHVRTVVSFQLNIGKK